MSDKKTFTPAQIEALSHRKPSGSPDGGQFTSFTSPHSTQSLRLVAPVTERADKPLDPDQPNPALRGLSENDTSKIYQMLMRRSLQENLLGDREDIVHDAIVKMLEPLKETGRNFASATPEERDAMILKHSEYFRGMSKEDQLKVANRVMRNVISEAAAPRRAGDNGGHKNSRNKAAYAILQRRVRDVEMNEGRSVPPSEYEAMAKQLINEFTAPPRQPFSKDKRPTWGFHHPFGPPVSISALESVGAESLIRPSVSAEEEHITHHHSREQKHDLEVLREAESRVESMDEEERKAGSEYNSRNRWKIMSEFYGNELGINVEGLLTSHPRVLLSKSGASPITEDGRIDRTRLAAIEVSRYEGMRRLGGARYLTQRWLSAESTPNEEETLFAPFYRGRNAAECDEIRGSVAQIFDSISQATTSDTIVDGIWRNALHTSMLDAAKAHNARNSTSQVAPPQPSNVNKTA